jgi:hypothetical protein
MEVAVRGIRMEYPQKIKPTKSGMLSRNTGAVIMKPTAKATLIEFI